MHWWRLWITESERDGMGYRSLPSRNVWLPDAGTLTIGTDAPADVIIADDIRKGAALARLDVRAMISKSPI